METANLNSFLIIFVSALEMPRRLKYNISEIHLPYTILSPSKTFPFITSLLDVGFTPPTVVRDRFVSTGTLDTEVVEK